jgi:N-acetylglucosamine-6-sulfatase
MNNLWNSNSTIAGYSLRRLQPRIDALLMVLKTCKGEVCIKPWNTLHPQGNVKTLEGAMESRYDTFYASQPKVSFEGCASGQIREVEGPQNVLPLSDEYAYLAGSHWSDWT